MCLKVAVVVVAVVAEVAAEVKGCSFSYFNSFASAIFYVFSS